MISKYDRYLCDAEVFKRNYVAVQGKENVFRKVTNLKKYEIIILWALAIPTIFFGFYPEPLINTVEVSIKNLIETHNLTIQMSLASK